MLLLIAAFACRRETPPVRATLDLGATLGGPAEAGFARALAPRPFVFPADHGPHPAFRTEWWYVTGNLEATGGDRRAGDDAAGRYGYQLTFFRSALAPPPPDGAPPRTSAWAAREVWMAHLAVTDVGERRFTARQRFARGAGGLAGARLAADGALRVWLGPWRLAGDTGAGAGRERFRIAAGDGGVALDLALATETPPVLQGDRGLSRKGPQEGNASFYYSLPRLATSGIVTLSGGDGAAPRRVPVRGSSWLDREWSTSALGADEVGWDWFALRLADAASGADDGVLMLYRLRRRDGTTSPWSAGSWLAPDGSTTPLAAADFAARVTRSWRSPRGGEYPAGWRIEVPRAALALDVEPWVADQELDLAIRYWEGTVRIRGTRGGRPVRGDGYVELTGYADTEATRTARDR